ncbi:hypothetical protein [Haloplanus sp.]|uniref:hypothetical protein n=1 Tax=Haloplanus sp. TaxID=1961696 RepID=UPI00260DB9EA|nr:hypothetical protein [Haloplanus sp.]
MDRRALLCLAGLTLTAGCSSNPPRASGPRTPPTPGEPTSSGSSGSSGSSLRVTDQGVEPADDGHLRVLVTVTNRGGAERAGTLVVTVSVEGSTTERRREVSVSGDGEREVVVGFEGVAFDDFSGGGSLRSRVE